RSPSSASGGTRAPFPSHPCSGTRRDECGRSSWPSCLLGLERAAPDLVALQRFEQGLEVAFAEALVALALDKLEEHRPEQGLREDLQQQALAAVMRGAIEQDAAALQLGDVLAMARQALLEHLVVDVVRRGHDGNAGHLQAVDAREDVVGEQRDVLDALAVELHQEFLDLPAALLGLLVQRDAD